MKKSKYFKHSSDFDLSKEDNRKVPKNPRDFILWFVGYSLPTFYTKSGRLHCEMFAYRSLDDTYHLVNKRWPMSELEFLDLVISVSQGNHGNIPMEYGIKHITFTFCTDIDKIVMQGSVFRQAKVAKGWTEYESFNNKKIIRPLLREYALNNL
jgi:hypothetical protein